MRTVSMKPQPQIIPLLIHLCMWKLWFFKM